MINRITDWHSNGLPDHVTSNRKSKQKVSEIPMFRFQAFRIQMITVFVPQGEKGCV
jgi:hypothetical protein